MNNNDFIYDLEKLFIILIYYLIYSKNNKNYLIYLNNHLEDFYIKHHKNIIKWFANEVIVLNSKENHFIKRVINLNISEEIKNENFTYFFKEYKKYLKK